MKGNPVKGRFLMIARSIPVESGGTMIIIRKLLEHFTFDEVIVLGRTPDKSRILSNEALLHYKTIEIPTVQAKGFRFRRLLSIFLGIPIGLYVIWRYKIKVIVGVFPDMGSLTLSYFLSVLTKRPLIAYFCDLYAENQKHGFHGEWAKWLQPKLFIRSKQIIVLTEAMKKFYKKQYGIEAICLPNSINGVFPKEVILPPLSNPFIIGFSGSIVLDRLDPLQALITAIGNDPRYEIRFMTPQSQDYLNAKGLWANNVTICFCTSQQELIDQLSQCHLLYLPLTFKTGVGYNSIPQLATCFGTKAYEYFLSCRPILTHSPEDYYTSTFFVENQCGYILNSIEVKRIYDFINDLKLNYDKQAPELVRNAIHTAQLFKGQNLADKFTSIINDSIIK